MADARDSKSLEGNFMWVRLPPPAPFFYNIKFNFVGILSPCGTSTPVGARPRTSRSRLWLEMTIQGHFFNASPPRRQLHVGSTPTTSTREKTALLPRHRFQRAVRRWRLFFLFATKRNSHIFEFVATFVFYV